VHVAPKHQFFDEEPRHDGLSGSRVVRQQVAEGLAGQHLPVHRRDLVRERLQERGVHGQVRIEEVGEAETLGLGGQAKPSGIRIKRQAPTAGDNLQARGLLGKQEDRVDVSVRGAVDHIEDAVPVRLYAEHSHICAHHQVSDD
jgi:hypothetical protein